MSKCLKPGRLTGAFVALALGALPALAQTRTLRHRPRRDPAGDRRLGHRRAAGRAGAAVRPGASRTAKTSTWPMRRLPRRVRRRRRALAAARRRAGTRSKSDDPNKTVGSYFALSVDRVRLCAPRHAVRRRAVAQRRRALRGRRLYALSQRHRGREIRAVARDFRQVRMPNAGGFYRRRPRDQPRRRSGIRSRA